MGLLPFHFSAFLHLWFGLSLKNDNLTEYKGCFFKVFSYTLFGHFRNSGPIWNILAVLEYDFDAVQSFLCRFLIKLDCVHRIFKYKCVLYLRFVRQREVYLSSSQRIAGKNHRNIIYTLIFGEHNLISLIIGKKKFVPSFMRFAKRQRK